MGRVSIDGAAIERMAAEIQREFDKHPIQVPIRGGRREATGTTIFNGPVIHGDAPGAQLAWNNGSAAQRRHDVVAPGYKSLADALAGLLDRLPALGFSEEQVREASDAAHEALDEVVSGRPDAGRLRRSLLLLKGCLSHLAAGLVLGADEGLVEWARSTVEHLHLPS